MLKSTLPFCRIKIQTLFGLLLIFIYSALKNHNRKYISLTKQLQMKQKKVTSPQPQSYSVTGIRTQQITSPACYHQATG